MKKFTSIPFFFYHSVTPLDKGMDGISPEVFQWQMAFLREHGYHTLLLDDIAAFMEGKRAIPEKSVAISFDDGYLDNWFFAYPILEKYQLRATIFINTAWVDREPSFLRHLGHEGNNKTIISEKELDGHRLSWSELNTMESGGLVDVQSHMHTHSERIKELVKKSYLTDEERTWLKEELTRSKELIEHRLNKSCNYVCWSWGLYNRVFMELAKECGYKGAVTSKRGPNCLGSDLMQIKRFYVRPRFGGGKVWFFNRLRVYSNTISASIYALFVRIITTPVRKILGIGF